MELSLIGEVIEVTRITEGGRELLQVRAVSGAQEIDGDLFGPAGTDAPPLKGDLIIAVKTDETGGMEPVGAIDTKNPGKAKQGEYRIYSRDANGNIKAEVWLKDDGSVRLSPAAKVEIGDGTRKPAVLDGDAVDINLPVDNLTFYTWANSLVPPLSSVGVTSLTGRVSGSAVKLESE